MLCLVFPCFETSVRFVTIIGLYLISFSFFFHPGQSLTRTATPTSTGNSCSSVVKIRIFCLLFACLFEFLYLIQVILVL